MSRLKGGWLPREEIDARLEDIAERYAPGPDRQGR